MGEKREENFNFCLGKKMEGPQLMLLLSEPCAELLAAFRVSSKSNANRDVTASILITVLIMLILTFTFNIINAFLKICTNENSIGVDVC
jgi:hypothetical protein